MHVHSLDAGGVLPMLTLVFIGLQLLFESMQLRRVQKLGVHHLLEQAVPIMGMAGCLAVILGVHEPDAAGAGDEDTHTGPL